MNRGSVRRAGVRCLAAAAAVLTLTAQAPVPVDTSALEQPWPGQQVRTVEVGRYTVTWRQLAGRQRGIFAGARFHAAAPIDTVWRLAAVYDDVGAMTPGVLAVRIAELDARHSTVDVTAKVLWHVFHLHFDVEQDPPHAIRFRVVHPIVGDYRGALLLSSVTPGRTQGEILTWLQPSRRVPQGLILTVERMVLLQGVENFIEACERAQTTQPPHP